MAKEPHGCPLCGQKCGTHDELREHIAREMQQLALFVVPSEYFDNESSSEVESSEEDHDSLATRAKLRLRKAIQLDKNADYLSAVTMYESAIGLLYSLASHRGSYDHSKKYIRELIETFTKRALHIKAFLNNGDPIAPYSGTFDITFRPTTYAPALPEESSPSSSPSKADPDVEAAMEHQETSEEEDHVLSTPDLDSDTGTAQRGLRKYFERAMKTKKNSERSMHDASSLQPNALRNNDIDLDSITDDTSSIASELSARDNTSIDVRAESSTTHRETGPEVNAGKPKSSGSPESTDPYWNSSVITPANPAKTMISRGDAYLWRSPQPNYIEQTAYKLGNDETSEAANEDIPNAYQAGNTEDENRPSGFDDIFRGRPMFDLAATGLTSAVLAAALHEKHKGKNTARDLSKSRFQERETANRGSLTDDEILISQEHIKRIIHQVREAERTSEVEQASSISTYNGEPMEGDGAQEHIRGVSSRRMRAETEAERSSLNEPDSPLRQSAAHGQNDQTVIYRFDMRVPARRLGALQLQQHLRRLFPGKRDFGVEYDNDRYTFKVPRHLTIVSLLLC